MNRLTFLLILTFYIQRRMCRDEDKIMKEAIINQEQCLICRIYFPNTQRDLEKVDSTTCFWPNEIYEPCFGGCAEVSCDNPRNHLRPCYPYCEPGCVCEDPYVRDDRTHLCVLPQDCSPTQMGIPVPTGKRMERASVPSPVPKFTSKVARGYNKRDDIPMDLNEKEPELPSNNINVNPKDDFKRAAEVSRMGNYFNIVIAPPPIKALQPRKLLQADPYRTAPKRLN